MRDVAGRRGQVSAACALVAALVVSATLFVVLYRGELTFDGISASAVEINAWGIETGVGIAPVGVVNGYPLAFAALLLLVAAVLFRPARTRSAARVVTAAGTAFLAGVGWSLGMQLSAFVESMRVIEAMEEDVTAEWSVGPGLGLLLIAGIFAAVSTAAAFLPTRRPPEPEDPFQVDLTTPRFGFPAPEPGS